MQRHTLLSIHFGRTFGDDYYVNNALEPCSESREVLFYFGKKMIQHDTIVLMACVYVEFES